MDSVRSHSRRLALLVQGLMIVIPLGWAGLMVAAALTGQADLPDGTRPVSDLTAATQAATAVLGSLAVGVVVLILRELHRLLRLYADGRVFVPEAADHIRRMGVLLIAYSIVDQLAALGLGVALWVFESLAEMPVYLEFDPVPVFIGLVVILLARIMKEASRMSEELDLTI